MKRLHLAALIAATAAVVATATGAAFGGPGGTSEPSPIYGVTIPDGYRQWELIAPAQEADPLNELRVVLGNKGRAQGLPRRYAAFP